eukprot:c15703_g2_i1 orf=3-1568(-)
MEPIRYSNVQNSTFVVTFLAALLFCWSFSTIANSARFGLRELPYPRARPPNKPFKRQSMNPSPEMHHMRDARVMVSTWWQDTHASSIQSAKDSGNNPLIFFPTNNGADPTGRSDSTSALQLTINQAFEVASTHILMNGITDLGGVEVHLGGGQYAISKPLSLPNLGGGGNVMIHGGTLRATSSFPSNGFLIELGSSKMRVQWELLGDKLATQTQPAYENIVLRNLMLDANYSAGGILLLNPLRTTISNCYITHFSSIGIAVHGGHETFIHNSFLGQHITSGGDPDEKHFFGTGIVLAGNDNAITDVTIFSAQIGIEVIGQANIITGVHCYNKATGWGGVGIMIRQGASQNRILGCYLDYTGIVLEDTRQITITNSFFLGDAFVLLKALKSNPSPSVFGVSIVDNMFCGSNHGVPIVQIQGIFSHVKQTCVDGNSANGMALRTTRARISTAGFGSEWIVDLSKTLLFPSSISHVQYSFFAFNQNGTFFHKHALKSVTSSSITVVSDSPIHATVSFYVDQSVYG